MNYLFEYFSKFLNRSLFPFEPINAEMCKKLSEKNKIQDLSTIKYFTSINCKYLANFSTFYIPEISELKEVKNRLKNLYNSFHLCQKNASKQYEFNLKNYQKNSPVEFHLLTEYVKIQTQQQEFKLIIKIKYRQNIQMPHYPDEIEYSDKYQDDHYEYRHVLLPKEVYRKITKGKLLSESEWRSLGVQQSRGWVHYELHKPEPHILLFRRALGTDPQTGQPPLGFVPPPDTFLYA